MEYNLSSSVIASYEYCITVGIHIGDDLISSGYFILRDHIERPEYISQWSCQSMPLCKAAGTPSRYSKASIYYITLCLFTLHSVCVFSMKNKMD